MLNYFCLAFWVKYTFCVSSLVFGAVGMEVIFPQWLLNPSDSAQKHLFYDLLWGSSLSKNVSFSYDHSREIFYSDALEQQTENGKTFLLRK